jgi:nitrite reductase/ring-hydroxylating ferredoxin subunit
VRLCRLDELSDGGSRGFDPFQEGCDTLFVVRQGSRVYAWRNACPHINGAPMAWREDAYLNADRDRIVCTAHGSQFDIVTDVCVLGPCLGQALEPLRLRSSGGVLYVKIGGT